MINISCCWNGDTTVHTFPITDIKYSLEGREFSLLRKKTDKTFHLNSIPITEDSVKKIELKAIIEESALVIPIDTTSTCLSSCSGCVIEISNMPDNLYATLREHTLQEKYDLAAKRFQLALKQSDPVDAANALALKQFYYEQTLKVAHKSPL